MVIERYLTGQAIPDDRMYLVTLREHRFEVTDGDDPFVTVHYFLTLRRMHAEASLPVAGDFAVEYDGRHGRDPSGVPLGADGEPLF